MAQNLNRVESPLTRIEHAQDLLREAAEELERARSFGGGVWCKKQATKAIRYARSAELNAKAWLSAALGR